jgi:UDP-N-acetyl-D-mannosaminuronic acid dehydrogenase
VETIAVSSPTTAELAKLADNWWIDLNIAMANEVALLAEEVGVDAMEVIEAANSLPKGQHFVNILYPGAGVGGSCLVKDPVFVANLGDEYGLDLQTPRVSRRVNDRMPYHVVERTLEALDSPADSSVAVLGYAFKGGTDDTRNTPAKPITLELRDAGIDLRVSDPFVPAESIRLDLAVDPQRLPEALSDVDAVVIVTAHEQYRNLSAEELISLVGHEAFTVLDGRFVFSRSAFAETNVEYIGIGRGKTGSSGGPSEMETEYE